MTEKRLMTSEEIHSFGIEIVVGQLRKEGYEIVGVNTKLDMYPQIMAKKNDVTALIVVRTACYPEKGTLEGPLHFQMINLADKHGAIPYFASVGIANANAETDEEMAMAVDGAGFYVAYEGLLMIGRSDRVKILDEGVLRDVTEDDLKR